MKRLLSFAGAAALLLCLLTGCTTPQEPLTSTDDGTTTTTAAVQQSGSTAATTVTTGHTTANTTVQNVVPTAPPTTVTVPQTTTTTRWQTDRPVTVSWLPAQEAYKSAGRGGVACPRMLTLANGTLLCAFDANDTYGGNSVIKVIQSLDGGATWVNTNKTKHNAVMTRSDEYIYANPAMLQLSNGDVMIAYRGMSSDDGSQPRNTGIFVSISHDNGVTWEPHSTVISYTQHYGGVYEPHLVEIDGVPTVFFANDSVVRSGESIGTGVNGIWDQPAVPSLDYQNIELMQWINGRWQNRTIACSGYSSRSRDGMPGVTQLKDGRWMLAYEASNTDGKHPFILRYKISNDGIHWDTSVAFGVGTSFAVPNKQGRKTSGPALATLPDGRIVCVFQTDQDASEAGDVYQQLRVIISNTADPNDGWCGWIDLFGTPNGYHSWWNGVAISGRQLFVLTSTNYPRSEAIYIRRAVLE